MKQHFRNSLFIVFLLSISLLSFSQIGFGPRVGLNLTAVAGRNSNSMFRGGPAIGAYIKIPLVGALNFQPELLYSLKGYGYNTGYGYKSTQRLSYLDIPLLLNYGASKGVYALAGIQPSVLLVAHYKYKGTVNTKENNTEEFNAIDLAIAAGLGYQFESGLNIDFRGSYGFIPIFPNTPNNRQHNITLQFTLGYTIGSMRRNATVTPTPIN